MPDQSKPARDHFEDFEADASEFELVEIVEAEDQAEADSQAADFEPLPADPLASKAWRLNQSETEVLAVLERGTFGGLKLVPWGSNYTFIAPICDTLDGQEYAVIYKPERGEAPLWDFPNGTLYKREYCAYLLSRAIGWNFIPPVVVREGPHGPGTVQLFVDVDERIQFYHFREYHEHELMRIVVFDYIANNADRKAGHCLRGVEGFIWGIDHGLCFNNEPKLRTVIWDFAGQPVPEDISLDLAELVTDSARIESLVKELRPWLEPREIEMFLRRTEKILNSGRFPQMSSRRQVPWGFY